MKDPEKNQLPDYPLRCFSVFQWKYAVDKDCPWWKRFYFRYVWLPFARFSHFKVGIIPFERLEACIVRCPHCDKPAPLQYVLSWKERQGVFVREEDAAREAGKYPYGGYTKVLLNAPEPRNTITGRTRFPSLDADDEYDEQIKKEEASAQLKVHQALNEAQKVIDLFRSTRA